MKIFVVILINLFLSACIFSTKSKVNAAKPPPPPPAWKLKLEPELERIAREMKDGDYGVLITDLKSGAFAGHNHEREWYLASTIKVPVAMEVLRQIEEGKISFDSTVKLTKERRRDGSGEVNWQPLGAQLKVSYLLEQMLHESDNAATDMLIDLVGIDNINKTVRREVPKGFREITSLLDVRRHAYGELHPLAHRLNHNDFMRIKNAGSYKKRLREFSEITRISPRYLRFKTIEEAFESYYQRGWNSATLVAYTELLQRMYNQKLVSPFVSKELHRLMLECRTGEKRLKAGLPKEAKFAHKTGTQVSRICDMGIVQWSNKAFSITACAEKWKSMAAAEKVLADVARAFTAAVSAP